MEAQLAQHHPAYLEERRRLGLDQYDELWEGVLHMNPMPSLRHQRVTAALERLLYPIVRRVGATALHNVGFYRSPDDYRGPDIAVFLPRHEVPLGITGALLVVEVLSPRDDSYRKLPWYAAQGVDEILIVHPGSLAIEVYRPVDGVAVLIEPERDGLVTLVSLPIRIGIDSADGHGLLRVVEPDGAEHVLDVDPEDAQ